MTSNKRRKYGDLSARPTPSSDPSLLEDVFQAFTGRKPLPSQAFEPDAAQPVEVPLQKPIPSQKTPRYREAIPLQETIPYQKPIQYRRDTVPENDTVPLRDTGEGRILDPWLVQGHMKVSHYVTDAIAPRLSPTQWAIYFRLYRLSYGWGKDECLVGNKRLRETTKVKETAIREAIAELCEMRLIEIIEVVNTAEIKGTRYKVNVFLPANTVPENDTVSANDTVLQAVTVPPNGPNKRKDDHDDLKKKDHHQSAPVENPSGIEEETRDETTMIVSSLYETLTGRRWKASDSKALAGVKSIGAEQLEQAMRTIHARSAQPIGSFAYFAKAIQAEQEGKGTQPRAGLRKKYEKMIREIRALRLGSDDYRLSDLIHDLKSRCAREGVTWNDDIANDVLGI